MESSLKLALWIYSARLQAVLLTVETGGSACSSPWGSRGLPLERPPRPSASQRCRGSLVSTWSLEYDDAISNK